MTMPACTLPRLAIAIAALAVAAGCATPPPPPPPSPPPPPPELDTATVCQLIVDVDDAAARGGLVAFRHDAERRGDERHAVFARHLSLATPEERFRAFHDELTARPGSVVGPLGECLVYAGWARMGPQATKACDVAATTLGPQRVLADIGRSQSALLHDADAARALQLADAGLAEAPGCAAFVVARARAIAATADAAGARDAWRDAAAALPGSFRCLTEAALAEERADPSPAGRAAAAALFERALAIAPDHADTLRRFAAATAGVDDVRALKAYTAAVKAGARDYPTLLAAARLAATLASTDDDVAGAIDLARRAGEASREDPEPRRLLVQLLARRGAWDDVIVAGNALLDLERDDPVARHALARAALAKGNVAAAVRHYDAASRNLSSLGSDQQAAVTAELQALFDRLLVDPAKAPKGGANVVASATQRQLQVLWRDRVKKKAVSKGGDLVVVAETDASGRVVDVDITRDDVGDPDLAGAAVAWLSRATIQGGARRYTMEFAVR
jgi:hypothetical protein